ncbi:MAG TPA: flagellar hook capping FlgD N-terminal domain-containing protein [Candidatus Aquilonibacter sp.]|nr:flagellar hook capping FlgD N-terminal domain-containing protein [Candidatus Aquilonibacter sp.]
MISQANLVNPYAADSSTNGTSNSSGSGSSSSSSGPDNELTGNSFLTLLTAQLQAQDPLNPVDPSTFMTELVQFNQLEQLININQTLSGLTSSGSSTNGSSPSGSAAQGAGAPGTSPASSAAATGQNGAPQQTNSF